ncbi:MAG TPA: DUF948 domain-containing protein [Gemmatimonadaceae bacterium]|jgi:uncharacterized protein YoxC
MVLTYALLVHSAAAGFAANLAQATATVHDTVFMAAPSLSRSIAEQVTAISTAITTIALMVLAVVTALAAWRFRNTYNKVDTLLDRLHGELSPVMQHARVIADNVNYVTTVVRADLAKVDATIDDANERVKDAVDAAERRLTEFNALLAVVQEEAEQVFLSTASTVRGVRRGAATFHDRGGTDFASDELDPADVADAIEQQLDGQLELVSQEERDGDDSDTQSATEALPTAPRVRPRTRRPRRA